jgi:hypothetical protein
MADTSKVAPFDTVRLEEVAMEPLPLNASVPAPMAVLPV